MHDFGCLYYMFACSVLVDCDTNTTHELQQKMSAKKNNGSLETLLCKREHHFRTRIHRHAHERSSL